MCLSERTTTLLFIKFISRSKRVHVHSFLLWISILVSVLLLEGELL